MIFGKYINRYYLKNAPVLLLGLLALLMVDYIQLLIPQFYRLVINGVNLGQVVVNGQTLPFTKEVLFRHICTIIDLLDLICALCTTNPHVNCVAVCCVIAHMLHSCGNNQLHVSGIVVPARLTVRVVLKLSGARCKLYLLTGKD